MTDEPVTGGIEVWHDHQRLATLQAGQTYRVEANVLVILDADDQEVTRYSAGAWSAVGVGVSCAYLADDPDCPRCHPPTAPG